MLDNQPAAQGPAHEGAADQAEGCRCGAQCFGALQAQALQRGAESPGSAVPAHHGDGAGAHAQQGIHAQHLREAYSRDILKDNQRGDAH